MAERPGIVLYWAGCILAGLWILFTLYMWTAMYDSLEPSVFPSIMDQLGFSSLFWGLPTLLFWMLAQLFLPALLLWQLGKWLRDVLSGY